MITEKSNWLQVIMIIDYDYPNSVFHTATVLPGSEIAFIRKPIALWFSSGTWTPSGSAHAFLWIAESDEIFRVVPQHVYFKKKTQKKKSLKMTS